MSKKPQPRPILHICASKDGAYMIRHQKGHRPPDKILIPYLIDKDPRMFVRNGELIKPYGIVEFEYERTELCPTLNHERAFYREIARRDFDPAGSVPIAYFNIEKLADDLNAAQAMVEKSLPDKAALAEEIDALVDQLRDSKSAA